jgi:hypothetical protein
MHMDRRDNETPAAKVRRRKAAESETEKDGFSRSQVIVLNIGCSSQVRHCPLPRMKKIILLEYRLATNHSWQKKKSSSIFVCK